MSVNLPQVGDLLEIRAFVQFLDQLAINVTHWKVTKSNQNNNLADIGRAFGLKLGQLYRNILSQECSYIGQSIRNITPPISAEELTADGIGPGVILGNNASSQASFLIRLKTNFGGRAMRGRIYPGPVPKGWTTDGAEIELGNILTLQALANAYGAPLVTTPGANETIMNLVIYHRKQAGPPVVQAYSTDVVAAEASQGIATQRRRGFFGRANSTPSALGALRLRNLLAESAAQK